MGYLEEFQLHINQHHYDKLMPLWEEYCANEQVDGHELLAILQVIRSSKFSEPFGKKAEEVIALWQQIEDPIVANEVLNLIFDLQTTNSKQMGEMAYQYLHDKYSQQPHFAEKIRLVGLKQKEKFQGALRNYELLSHMEIGKFVFHTGGWGTGEILNISLVREQASIEFENLSGHKKEVSFEHAFKTLIALPETHFLVMRFATPDELEAEARKDSLKIVRLFLENMGPKTAAEIKEEFCDRVIPEKDWTKWWQQARSKIKKDTLIETPNSLREPFRLRHKVINHEVRLFEKLKEIEDLPTFIQATYNFLYDFPELVKQPEVMAALQAQLNAKFSHNDLSETQKIELNILWEETTGTNKDSELEQMIVHHPAIENLLQNITVTAFKKRILVLVRNKRADWQQIFLDLLLNQLQHSLRDYLFKELMQPPSQEQLIQKLYELLHNPTNYPIAFIWYFQKIVHANATLLQDNEHTPQFFEGFLILLYYLESQTKYREQTKKMYTILAANRYAVIRKIFEQSTSKQVEEFLLLTSKCAIFTDHDLRILQSLAEIAHPDLPKKRRNKESSSDEQIIWTTQEGFNKTKARLAQIATIETIENAKEIEEARALGDLRENSEFKFALERRARLQSELGTLTKQISQARIIIKEEVSTETVGIGTVATVVDSKGKTTEYTLLGPWDAEPDQNILSIYSKFAQALLKAKVGDVMGFQEEKYTIKQIRSYFDSTVG